MRQKARKKTRQQAGGGDEETEDEADEARARETKMKEKRNTAFSARTPLGTETSS
jgi:hypothetical protein